METVMTLRTYNTDLFSSYGIGQTKKRKIDWTFENVLKYAIEIKATIIVKPSRGKYWYIKGIKNNKSYEEIKSHLDTNLHARYRVNSKTWLISYL